MTGIYLVRHAQTTGNIENRLTGIEDYPLTIEGEEGTEILADYLKNVKFDNIYCSFSTRTEKTVEKIAQNSQQKIIHLKDLSEMNFGIYDGMKWEEVNKINPTIKFMQKKTNEIIGIKGQESTKQVADRMYKCIKNICDQNDGKTILICSHGIAIEAFLRKICQVPFAYERKKFCQFNLAINKLTYENEKFEITKLANTSYLKFKINERMM